MQHFNPIQSKWVVAALMRTVRLLQQSIPFCVKLVYILVHVTRFSFINFVVLNAEKSSSLHTIILEKPKQTKQLVVLIFNQVYFSFY